MGERTALAADVRAMRKNHLMLSLSVQRQLAELMAAVYQLLESVHSVAAKPEVSLRIAAARQKADDLRVMIEREPVRAFNSLDRHLHWLERFYLEDRPDRYASDIRDIRMSGLPGVIAAVEDWNSGPLDDGLFAAINNSWETRQFSGAIRDTSRYGSL